MSYSIIWQPTALNTYIEEVDFVFLKWNFKEVQKFQDLVIENLERLSKNPEMGIFNTKFKTYSLVLSNQTTLYYNFNSNTKIIELNLFWNNSKNPVDLTKLLY
jgi:plasmid stabilization system protein ParE